ncbi:pentapeptide repeat-containing protein [Kamptonema sp. PCC 6506]|uniref:pentapeptide repeat-containing protein n=1 Tax=Kamptonema sp. PCC 6506 TaxID=272129 RepID=UPI001F2D2E26|nr:pentapeptide repeat-containing protein [Kamptonema sp. PCC 6506]
MAVSIGSVVFYISIALRAIAGDDGLLWLREFALVIAATGGTSFRNADLTDADFTSATLKSTDFRKANLTRTQWYQAKKLDRVLPGTTYLQIAKIRQLLITGQGQAQNFNRQNLRGINLQGANLADASFISADLSSAKLQDADLSRAKLVQTQLDEADLKGATLTGAYIEDWGITSHTKLHGVRNAINQLPDSSKPDKPGIKELLVQLQAAINDPNLADDDKTQVLEQVKVLAEAGQNPNKETAQKQAKRAMGFLKVIAEGLPSAAQLVKTCQDILPAIAHYFGL